MGKWIYHLARVGLAVAFLVAGAIKLNRPEVFAVTVKAFGILPDAVIPPLSLVLPCLEIVAGVLLLFELRGGLALTTGLLAVFVAVLVYALRMGLDIDCGCYGPADPEREAFGSLRESLWRDGVMLAAVGYQYWWKRSRSRRAAAGARLEGSCNTTGG